MRVLRSSLLVLLCTAVVLTSGGPAAHAQTPDVRLTTERRPIEVGVEPGVQSLWADGNTLRQWSSRLWVSVPVGASTTVWGRTRAAHVSATGVAALGGLGDTQLGALSSWSVGSGSLVATLSGNLPSGRQSLADDQVATSALIGQDAFGLDVPRLGDGWGGRAGLTYAFPVGDRVMLGLGGAVRYLGPYAPLDRLDATYDPGDEVLLATGFDVRLSRTAAWSVDAAYTVFGTDDFDGTETIAPGDRWVLTSQVRSRTGRRDLRALVRYVGRDRSTVPALVSSVDGETLRSVPNSMLGQVELGLPVSPTTRVLVQAGGAHYTETAAADVESWSLSDARTLGRVGGGLDLRLGSAVHWRPQAAFTFGDFQSVSARMGIVWRH